MKLLCRGLAFRVMPRLWQGPRGAPEGQTCVAVLRAKGKGGLSASAPHWEVGGWGGVGLAPGAVAEPLSRQPS